MASSSINCRPSVALWLLAACFVGCGDPVHDGLVQSLGPEKAGVPVGPRHRPGQPCLACHAEGGAAEPAFSIAGTLYREKDGPHALGGVEVQIVDSAGQMARVRSNCAGNFYVSPARFRPTYPLWVTLAIDGETIDMESPVYRDGSCASCHLEPLGPRSAGPVYMTDDPEIAERLAARPCTEPDDD